jgi:hypothetical protein
LSGTVSDHILDSESRFEIPWYRLVFSSCIRRIPL